MRQRNSLILHTTVTQWSTLAMDAELARSLGFDGMELSGAKVQNYFDAGYSQAELSALLDGLQVPALGFVTDLEREEGLADLLVEAEDHCRLAKAAGAEAVQVITGPINVEAVRAHHQGRPFDGYSGLLGRDTTEQIRINARNLAQLADLASGYGLKLYLEALAWTPLNTLAHQQAIIDQCGRDNVRLVIDFWHCYASGDGPEQIARLPRELLLGVHFCDSRRFDGGVPDESILRDVSTGSGVLNLQEWVDAVKATGYDDWWSCELFCKRDRQGNSREVARDLKSLMRRLILGSSE
jgi:sugar phosphate isomerase/epimerase